jgi:hypothetical protein
MSLISVQSPLQETTHLISHNRKYRLRVKKGIVRLINCLLLSTISYLLLELGYCLEQTRFWFSSWWLTSRIEDLNNSLYMFTLCSWGKSYLDLFTISKKHLFWSQSMGCIGAKSTPFILKGEKKKNIQFKISLMENYRDLIHKEVNTLSINSAFSV